jgi:hypothetical protein
MNAAEPTQHRTALMPPQNVMRMLFDPYRGHAQSEGQTTSDSLRDLPRASDVATTELLLKAGVDVNIRAKRDSVPFEEPRRAVPG